jgi:putative component of membrane protein insertase Oxa1/YidC/SpoIIIJ protein YidD
MKTLKRHPAFLILALSTALSAASGGDFQEPWANGGRHPIIDPDGGSATVRRQGVFEGGETFARSACFVWLKFYQNCLSLFNTVKCPMEPSCSNYSILAVKKHGAIIGVVLTADRLLHEPDEQHIAPMIIKEKRPKFLDPVENNDFWWFKQDE